MLGPNPDNFEKGLKDPGYLAQLQDQADHPENWGVRGLPSTVLIDKGMGRELPSARENQLAAQLSEAEQKIAALKKVIEAKGYKPLAKAQSKLKVDDIPKF
ncbi:hypothetical protein LCGC14_1838030 [marine sediment metagenome]|uniref:Uncharacterized protein n=1 Tax=marine sediment metagenome TaxID=412755 RepID=A0A0F9H280_9ZZZZ